MSGCGISDRPHAAQDLGFLCHTRRTRRGAAARPHDRELFPPCSPPDKAGNRSADHTVSELGGAFGFQRGLAVVRPRCLKHSIGHAAVLAGALAVAAFTPGPAQAGFFDFLFGNSQDQQAPQPQPQSYAEPPSPGLDRVAPAPLAPKACAKAAAVAAAPSPIACGCATASTFRSNAWPMRRRWRPAGRCARPARPRCSSAARSAAPSPRTARIMPTSTPPSSTASSWSPIAPATAGMRVGLAPFDLSSDPTLRPGDIVATKDGLDGLYRQERHRPTRSRRSIRRASPMS